MLADNFEMLIFSDNELKNTYEFICHCETDKTLCSKIFGLADFYSYAIKQEFDVYEIKPFIKKLFDILHEEARSNRKIYLVVYDIFEIFDAINEKHKIVKVDRDSQCYDFIYHMEQSNLWPLIIYKF